MSKFDADFYAGASQIGMEISPFKKQGKYKFCLILFYIM